VRIEYFLRSVVLEVKIMSGYKINILGDDLSLEQTVSKDIVNQVVLMLIKDRVGVSQFPIKADNSEQEIPKTYPRGVANKDRSTEFAKFIDMHGARRACEIVTCVGVYLYKKGEMTFSKDHYRTYFRGLKGKSPSNVPRDFKWALDINWIIEVSPNSFQVTSTGVEVVEEQFPSLVRGSTLSVSHKQTNK